MGSYEFRHPDVCSCPDICPADFDGNCAVDVKDLLFLLGEWFECDLPCPPSCPADFDDSCAVDVKDLLFLLGAWGPCPCNLGAEVLSLPEEMENVGLTMDDWEEFEEVMTDPESSQEDKDRYYCWMDHYLNHCTGMACTTPNCPGDARSATTNNPPRKRASGSTPGGSPSSRLHRDSTPMCPRTFPGGFS